MNYSNEERAFNVQTYFSHVNEYSKFKIIKDAFVLRFPGQRRPSTNGIKYMVKKFTEKVIMIMVIY